MMTLAGCATSGVMNSLELGMTKSEVIEFLGDPVSTSASSGTEYLNYKFSETDDDAFIGLTTNYYVRFTNGVVDSFGRLGDFDSTQDPTVRIETDQDISTSNSTSPAERLREIRRLYDDGLLTESEYEALRTALLGEL